MFRLDIVWVLMLSAPVPWSGVREIAHRSSDGIRTARNMPSGHALAYSGGDEKARRRPSNTRGVVSACGRRSRRSAGDTCLPWVLTRSRSPAATGQRDDVGTNAGCHVIRRTRQSAHLIKVAHGIAQVALRFYGRGAATRRLSLATPAYLAAKRSKDPT